MLFRSKRLPSLRSLLMPGLLARIAAIEAAAPPGGFGAASPLPGRAIEDAIAVLSDGDFAALPPMRQTALLDFIHAAYISTYDASAPRMAQAVGAAFRMQLETNAPLPQLMKTYDLLYFLYWCAAVSIEEQRGFDSGAVPLVVSAT